jgi:UDP-GlcNAc:undecaprenyl-phosphate/decaprenyl-phosphate GlcNAc-1-phosphate transferase
MIGAASNIAAGLIAGVLSTYVFRRIAERIGFVAKPNPLIRTHKLPVAYMGGPAVWTAAVGALVFTRAVTSAPQSIPMFDEARLLLASAPYLFFGLYDDRWPLEPGPKLFYQTLMAIAGLTILDPAFWLSSPHLLACGVILIVVVVNAVNLTDVSDVYAGSIAVVSLSGLAGVIAADRPVLLCVAGATAGFLFFNRAPASIYLGDSGSHLLGAVLGLCLVRGLFEHQSQGDYIVAASTLMMIGVPLYELAFLIFVRRAKGLPWWRGSPDHVALRLQASGLSRDWTAILGATAQIALVIAAIAFEAVSNDARMGITGLLGVALIACTHTLLRHDPRKPQ